MSSFLNAGGYPVAPEVGIDPGVPAALATRLQADYGLALAAAADAPRLVATHGSLALDPGDGSAPLRVELAPGAPRRRQLERAIGLGRGTRTVVDATAGLGRDAWSLIRAGLDVTLCERSGWLAALLDDALEQAGRAERVHFGCAAAWLRDASPDAVLLDPMFAPRGKSALPKREIALLRRLLGPDNDGLELLEVARRAARCRVVVKRHRSAPRLGEAKPIAVIDGRTVRYDVYGPAAT